MKDGVIAEPTKCHFDPEKLLCKGADASTCLTQPQVEALRKIYAGPRTSTGEQIFPGILPGNEAGLRSWNTWIIGPEPGKSLQFLFGVQATGKMTYQNPAWDFRTFNFDRDVAFVDEKSGPTRNATSADLAPFKARGGKLILYHGWNDPSISPLYADVSSLPPAGSKLLVLRVDDTLQQLL
jgi:feruloyl esterase